ncbi:MULTISPECIES: hypothetical protein, partial [Paraburkholderia]|uniref:hypothetical protein n=1 Tax=Paraburkholderia TaxID=1822464 RepID=UPI001C84F650
MQKAVPCGRLFSFALLLARIFHARKRQNPGSLSETPGFWTYSIRSLTITYFHTGNPHYHRRGAV